MEIQAALDMADETDSFLQITDVVFDKEAEFGYDQLKNAEKTVYCIDGLLREMENGGFVQFFRREAGDYTEDTLTALESIKARESYAILDKMIDLFPERNVPTDEDERSELFDSIESEYSDEITELDDGFHDTGENLVKLTLLYLQRSLKESR